MVSSLISSITGTLEANGPDWVEVAVGGITLRVSVPASTAERLGPKGERVRLFTSLQVREDSLTLLGFASEEARMAFEALIGISGVGPRLALSISSRLAPGSLASAVSSDDTDALSAVPGVGKKTASRIVLELKGKLDGGWAVPAGAGAEAEVVGALTALGYTSAEAREAVSSLPPGDAMSLEDRVLQALQSMGGR